MSKVAKDIKQQYIRPAVIREEYEWNKYRDGKLRSLFHVEEFIWLDVKMPEYRVAIPEEMSEWAEDETLYRSAHNGNSVRVVTLLTRFITYKPTGKIVYDNSLPQSEAIVFEYQLEYPKGELK